MPIFALKHLFYNYKGKIDQFGTSADTLVINKVNFILELKNGHTNKGYILLKTLLSRGRVLRPSGKIEHLIIFKFSCSNY